MNNLNVFLLSISDAENTFNYLQDDELYLYIQMLSMRIYNN